MQHNSTDPRRPDEPRTPSGSVGASDSIPPGEATGAQLDEPEFDIACLQSVANLDPDGEIGLIRELAATFSRDSQEKIDGVRRQLETGDAGAIHALTHQLKSSSGTLGLLRVYRLSRQIDDDARQGGLAVARELFGQLEQALVSGRAWLEEFARRQPGA